MFRDLYKKANDDIKGDRAILDKAFLQAAQPVKKKSPVIKYSFIGTAVAAVMVLGAVFTNPSVFTNRSETIGKTDLMEPTESESVVNTLITHEAEFIEDAVEDELIEEKAVIIKENRLAQKVVTENKTEGKVNDTKEKNSDSDDSGEDDDGDVAMGEEAPQNDYSVAMTGLEEDLDEVYEAETAETIIGFSLRDRNVNEEETEEAVEDVTEEATEPEAVETFSYMYDLSVYEGVTEGFVNVDISPVETAYEAIERAKKEINYENYKTLVHYDVVERIWKITFSSEENSRIVYISSDGMTQLIVYGE